ncbi:unnamed protein product [Rotaria socialis]|uniref:GRIP domain-containing protein n=1 Tax=Rotaria socialis TaxID=392032 RepID=A0A820SA18_9BILA|nr:unnamed protein product [Rotaria socialis]CAF4447147.1 unnamed protein product [Rotaria socialis]
MSDEKTSDEKTAHDEKSATAGKLESMSKEEIIKVVKNQVLLKKKLEIKINELTASNTNFSQIEEQLRQQIEHEQSKYSKLMIDFEQNKIDQLKTQEELNTTHELLARFRLENETLQTSCQNQQVEITNLQNQLTFIQASLTNESQKSLSHSELLSKFISTSIDRLQLPISPSNKFDDEFLQAYTNELNQKQENFKQLFEHIEEEKLHLQQRIEDLEFLNEEVKLDLDDLRLKSINYQQDKKSMEKELDNYRRQIEDFEEQFLELQRESHCNHLQTYENSSKQLSVLTLNQIDENLDEIIDQCMNSMLNQIESNNQHISKASSTSSLLLSSDIPTLLHSIGITNCTDEDFSVPLNFESVLRLSTLLVERCRVLQYILLKNNDMSINSLNDADYYKDCALFVRNDGFEQCKIFVRKQDHIALDTLFERIYVGMNETIKSDEWQIVIEKSDNQKSSSFLRLQFDNFKFVSGEIEQNLIRLRSRHDDLIKENEEQQNKISLLEQRLYSNHSYEQLKEHQAQLEEQLAKQCEKTIQLESILTQENIDKIKVDQLKQIELSYNELQQKYHIVKQLEEHIQQLNQNLNDKELELQHQHNLFDRLKKDYDNQHLQLLERDENIHSLKFQLEQDEKSKESLIEKYQNQMNQFRNDLEQQKLTLINAAQNQDELYSFKSKQQNELNDLVQTKINENKQLDNDLKQNHEIILEKNKQIDHYQKQLNLLNVELDQFKIKSHETKEEKNKLINEIDSLMNQVTNLEKEKLELIQNIDNIKQQLERNDLTTDQDKLQLRQTIENLQHELDSNKIHIQDVQLNQSNNKSESNQANLNDHHESELEHVQHNQVLNNTNDKSRKSAFDSEENIQELKEKYHKMKVLLTRLKRELQEKNQHQPKQSLIDLELADYEKTINNLKDELMNKDKEIQDLHEELSNSTDKYACLKIENKNLEQQNQQIEQRANKFKALLDLAKKELQTAKNIELQRHYNDDHVRVLLEKLQNDFDNNKILITELQNEKQHLIEKLNNQNETSQRTINLLEQNLSIVKHDLDIAKQDNDTLEDDFNSYKIRAQSVLKQHQMNQRERLPSVVDKQVELEETIEKLNTTVREANDRILALICENDILQKEQERLIEFQAKLINEPKKREQDLRKQHKLEIDKIENEYLQRINDIDDKLKSAILLNETLSTVYKEQIVSMESDYEHSISTLKNELETTRQELEQLKIRIDLLRQTNIDNEKLTSNTESSQIGINNHSNRDDTLACSTCERQQGEEFESASVEHQLSHIPTKTLDNASIDTSSTMENTTTTTLSSANDKSLDISFEKIEFERQRLEEELHTTKIRLLDTAELLNESELNNARLDQQVTVLKDEIRRIERNMDRAESISNLEYLKNIIVKFFILKSTDERLQLIPVLVTMLKLSPDEQAQLVRVANLSTTYDENLRSNESQAAQITNNNVNSPSWSSYLNIW